MTDLQRAVAPLIDRLDALFDRIEAVLPPPLPATDWSATAFRWRTRGGRGWLEAIAKQLKVEVVVDAVALDQGAFKTRGGRARANAIFGGRIDTILAEIQDAVWAKDSA